MFILQRMSLKYKAGSSFSQQRLDSLKAISVNTRSDSCDDRPAIRRQRKPESNANSADLVPREHEDGCGLWRNDFGEWPEEHVPRDAANTDP